ncbi:hypothetical protein ACH4ZX_21370 [Streptomyces sp. NPDC020490]|uniref:hypothetical protein n=1 Tax=Streptomyces sp. NPDC020490 TaxID=3365078 RepID=UPI0037A3D3B9
MRRPPVHEWAVLDEDGDPVPGDPDAVALLGQSLRDVAQDIQREAGDVEALCGVESWKSKAAKLKEVLVVDRAGNVVHLYP